MGLENAETVDGCRRFGWWVGGFIKIVDIDIVCCALTCATFSKIMYSVTQNSICEQRFRALPSKAQMLVHRRALLSLLGTKRWKMKNFFNLDKMQR